MKKNKQGFAIVFAMGMALVSTLIVIYLLEYMIPFSKNVKGIENSTAAYYNAMSGLEEALYFTTVISKVILNDPRTETGVNLPTTPTGYAYRTFASGTTLPTPGYGNSEFSTNWSKLMAGEPVQIRLPSGITSTNWNGIKLFLRVPSIAEGSTVEYDLTGDVVNWQLSSAGDTLNSQSGSNSRFKDSDISNSGTNPVGIVIGGRQGKTLGNTDSTILAFYDNQDCDVNTYSCTLKFSIINNLIGRVSGVGGKIIPYLEYKIVFPINVPSNVVRINIKGKSYGFQKEFDIYSPRESLIEAYDFTVFQ